MSNILLLKAITKQHGVYLSDDLILYISNLSKTPICRLGVRLAVQSFRYVLEDIHNIHQIYTYDMNSKHVSLQDEYHFRKTISKHCRHVHPLNRTDYDAHELHIQYDMDGYGGYNIYDYFHHMYDNHENLEEEKLNQLVSINWCGIDIINHFRRINPIHYMSYQITRHDLLNSDSRILTIEENMDITAIPDVLALREANYDDFNSRIARSILYEYRFEHDYIHSTSNLYETMLHLDMQYVNNFWKNLANNNSKILWRPLSDVENGGEVPTIEAI